MNPPSQRVTAHPSAPPAHPAHPLTVTAYGPTAHLTGFEVLAAEWNPLLEHSRFRSVFLTHEWQTTWWRHLGSGDLWIVALRESHHGQLVGIAPLYLAHHTEGRFAGQSVLHLIGCVEVSDYLDVIVNAAWEGPAYAALAAWLAGPDAPAWDVLDLCNLPEESMTHRLLPPCLEVGGLTTDVHQEDTAPQFALPVRYETYLQEQVDKKQRHEIRRKQRRAEREAAVGFTMVGKEHSLEAEMDDFIALQRASRFDKSEFMTPQMRRFFLAAARCMYDAGWLRLSFLTLDGEKAAALLAFEYDRRYMLYNSGYDPDSHAQLSPGWVLLAYTIQYAIAAGCTCFDFMQGGEEYKYRFGSHDYKVMRLLAHRAG